MTFCAGCGSAITQGSGFCPGCGKPVATVSQGAVAAAPAVSSSSAASGLTPNLAGALAYILGLITGVLFLVLEPYKRDPFVRFHAMQSVLYSAAVIVFSIAWRILVSILSDINPWLALATFPIRLLISLGFFGLWLFVMYQAHSGREYRIPFIGGFAAKQIGKATALAS
jgi:uncharacterized membrane protein